MVQVKFQRVISFSSEDPNQPADNLLSHETSRKWRCKAGGEPKEWVELLLDKMCQISNIHIGNYGSAFVQVLVGRTGCSEEDYKVLLDSRQFMSFQDCQNETHLQQVQMFRASELNKVAQAEKWDRIRLVCTQPFNRHLRCGLSFVAVHEEEAPPPKAQEESSKKPIIDLGGFKLREEPVDTFKPGAFFSQRLRAAAASAAAPTPCDSPTTTPGAIRAVSQNLAAQSDKEAARIIKKAPAPDQNGRPDFKLTDKLKTQSPKATQRDLDVLPSRKMVESDRPAPIKPQSPSIEKKAKKAKRPKSPGGQQMSSQAVKSPAPAPESSQKRKAPSTPSESPVPAKKMTKRTKPFNRLLEGATVVLSGFQNPLRGQLRDKLQAMGAKYKPDWGPSCTHLVCAFYNTPKFKEVKGKGKIVTKDWVESCYNRRRRLPWRRFCLDRSDQGEESEEEILEGPEERLPSPVSESAKPNGSSLPPRKGGSSKEADDEEDYGGSTEVDEPDTDDEIDQMKKKIQEEEKGKQAEAAGPHKLTDS